MLKILSTIFKFIGGFASVALILAAFLVARILSAMTRYE